VIPPKLAPFQVVIVPIYKSEAEFEAVCTSGKKIKSALENVGIRVKLDDRDTHKPGYKFAEHEFRGVPLRIAIGPRDLENGTVEVARRDTLEKFSFQQTDLATKLQHLLDQIQENLFTKALQFRETHTFKADTLEEFTRILDEQGGFVYAHWDGTVETEQKIKEMTKATIRCIPLNNPMEQGNCILTGKPSSQRVVFARAY
jgi:prolyl-tRNA synthetase